jgi:hypothetical protein
MAKITAIIVTIIGILLVLKELNVLSVVTDYNGWLIAIGVLVIGIAKLIRNFKK